LTRRNIIIALVLAAALRPNTNASCDDGALARRVQAIHDLLWTKFVHPGTNIMQTRPSGWGALEDTSLYGGMYLAAMVDRWEVTRSPEDAAKAGRIFDGLVLNATAGPPGFIARGVAPDRKRFCGDPSVDQYTGVLYGLWRLYRSDIATDDQKKKIRDIYAACLQRLESHKFVILDSDGKTRTKFCHLAAVRPTRSERLLSFVLAGWKITGNRHWLEVYDELKKPRLATCREYPAYDAWVLIQSAVSLRMLIESEDRPGIRRVYEEGLASCARRCIGQVPAYRGYLAEYDGRESKEMVKRLRDPIEAIAVILLSGDKELSAEVVQPLREILEQLHPAVMHCSPPLNSLEWDYWLARKAGLLRRDE